MDGDARAWPDDDGHDRGRLPADRRRWATLAVARWSWRSELAMRRRLPPHRPALRRAAWRLHVRKRTCRGVAPRTGGCAVFARVASAQVASCAPAGGDDARPLASAGPRERSRPCERVAACRSPSSPSSPRVPPRRLPERLRRVEPPWRRRPRARRRPRRPACGPGPRRHSTAGHPAGAGPDRGPHVRRLERGLVARGLHHPGRPEPPHGVRPGELRPRRRPRALPVRHLHDRRATLGERRRDRAPPLRDPRRLAAVPALDQRRVLDGRGHGRHGGRAARLREGPGGSRRPGPSRADRGRGPAPRPTVRCRRSSPSGSRVTA